MTSLTLLRHFGEHAGRITSLAYSPRGDRITCGYQDGGVVSWDVATGTPHATYAEHGASSTNPILSVAYSPDGELLAATNLGYYPVHGERAVHVWRMTDDTLVYQLGGFRYWVYAVAFSPDGALLAVGGDDRWVKLYDLQSGKECGPALPQLSYSVSALAFSPHGRQLVAGCDGSQIKIWNLDAGSEQGIVEGHVEWTWALAFHPSGESFASGGEDGSIFLWDAVTARRLRDVNEHLISPGAWGDDAVSSLAFNPPGTFLANANAGHTVALWDTTTGEPVAAVHHDGVRSVAFSPDGALLASGGDHGGNLWQVGK